MALLVASALKLKFQTALTRLFRLCKNERFDPRALLAERLEHFNGAEIIVDWSRCGPFEVLFAAAPLSEPGRAMLLFGEAYRAGRLEGKQNAAEIAFVHRLGAALERAERFEQTVFVFDRGFCKDELLRALKGFRFVVRAKLHLCCRTRKNRRVRLDTYARRLADGQLVKGLRYKCDACGERPVVNLVVRKRRIGGKWHRWYLLTRLEAAEALGAIYERRFWIEETFNDAKTCWRMDQRRFRSAERMTRYLGLLALVHAVVCQAMVAVLVEVEDLRQRLGESGRNRLSLPNLYLRAAILCPEVLNNARFRDWCL